MPQLMGNTQSPLSNNTSVNPFDVLKVLLDNSDIGQQQSLNGQDSTQNQQNAYQKGVNKALSEQGYKHGAEALSAGVDPNEIVSHQSMQPQDNGAQVLSSLVNPVNNTPSVPKVPLTGILSKLLGMDLQPDVTNQRLSNVAAVQKIEAGQPADIAVPQAQAQALQQKIAGAEPIQPKDIADLNRQTYSATIQAANDAWQRNNDELSKMQEQYKTLQEGRSGFSKTIGGQTEQMKALQNVIVQKMKENQQHMANLQTLLVTPPKAVESQSNNSPFQVGQKYNGEVIKNVKRIK